VEAGMLCNSYAAFIFAAFILKVQEQAFLRIKNGRTFPLPAILIRLTAKFGNLFL
jgi:hypothetical protein